MFIDAGSQICDCQTYVLLSKRVLEKWFGTCWQLVGYMHRLHSDLGLNWE